jgi:hypothetical protein
MKPATNDVARGSTPRGRGKVQTGNARPGSQVCRPDLFAVAIAQLETAQRINKQRSQATAYMRRWRQRKKAAAAATTQKETMK